ncbi:fluoride efflux transporter FluC [Amycolatopsis rifamycinica]|uniref:Fluoride-specific ion channel FluC n=1 Tax=Amycolatopsis rifamycinica TaxID=287986 RepID=A0A066UAH6_9PSEU|nr:CrcB family protein [Amycolatopsis rifamycinica]KDN21109.1 chromosome condensation protein CrcB [Amycolatopsis rifamycinica]
MISVPRWDVLAVIGAGGALGSLARYGLSVALPHARGEFAVATLVTNVLGCLLIGVLMAILTTAAQPHHLLRPFLGVGILGGFTTFSTFVTDTLDAATTGRLGESVAYVAASLALCLTAVAAGLAATRAVRKGR